MSSISTTAFYASLIFSFVIILNVESNSVTQSSSDNRESTAVLPVLTPLDANLAENGTNFNRTDNGSAGDLKPSNKTESPLAKLAKYFKIRGNCPDELDEETNSSSTAGKFCPPVADFLLCFPKTPVNQTLRIQCPYRDDLEAIDSSGKLS